MYFEVFKNFESAKLIGSSQLTTECYINYVPWFNELLSYGKGEGGRERGGTHLPIPPHSYHARFALISNTLWSNLQ